MSSTTSTRTIRRVLLALVLPLAALAVSCTPSPASCPTVHDGAWSGAWYSGGVVLGGAVNADITVEGSTISGTIALVNSPLSGPVSGTMHCDSFSAGNGHGLTLTGTVSETGDQITGTYTSLAPADTGTFTIQAVRPS